MSLANILFGVDTSVIVVEPKSGFAVCRKGGGQAVSIEVDLGRKRRQTEAICRANQCIHYSFMCINCTGVPKRECQVAELAESPFPTEDGL